MFGLIISSRPVNAIPEVIAHNQLVFKVSSSPSFSHIVVFLLPGAQLAPNNAASVYVQIPPSQEFRLLGGIGPGKESAIFKISGLKQDGSAGYVAIGDVDLMTDDSTTNPTAVGDIVVGISIEPTAQVESRLLALKSQQQQALPATSNSLVRTSGVGPSDTNLTTKVLAQRIIGNAFNFLASFGSDTVPLKAFQGWWDKFEKKIDLDPGFLERE